MLRSTARSLLLLTWLLSSGCLFHFDRSLSPGEITGTVVYRSEQGALVPASGGVITLENSPLSVTADSLGHFVIAGIPAGTYSLDLTASPSNLVSADVGLRLSGITVALQDGVDLGQIVLETLGAIDGTVTRNGSAVLSGATVAITGLAETAVTDGAFTFPTLLPGLYQLAALDLSAAGVLVSQAATVQVNPGETAQLSLALSGASTGALQGTVLVSGAGSNGGVDVQVSGGGPDLTTSASGSYSAGGVQVGLYTVTAALGGFTSVSVPFVLIGAGTTVVPTITLIPTSVLVPDAGAEQPCLADSECPAGEVCLAGFCAPATDAGAPDGGSADGGLPDAGGACTTAADCTCDGEMACVANECAADTLWTQWGPVPSDEPTNYAVTCPSTECLVTDKATGLIWQQTVSTNPCPVDGGTTACNQAQAVSYCANLSYAGLTGWRLPSVTELSTLVDHSGVIPTLDNTAFPATPQSTFWTSTLYAGSSASAWEVSFFSGFADSLQVVIPSDFVRCVR